MFLYGDVEFRGCNERKSKEGKIYYLLVCEDLENSDQIRLYSPSSAVYTIPRENLKRGCVYHCKFDYHYNSFNKDWQFDLIDIVEQLKG